MSNKREGLAKAVAENMGVPLDEARAAVDIALLALEKAMNTAGDVITRQPDNKSLSITTLAYSYLLQETSQLMRDRSMTYLRLSGQLPDHLRHSND